MKQFLCRHKKALVLFCTVCFLMSYLMTCSVSAAMSDSDIISTLTTFDLEPNNFIFYPMRQIGWTLAKGLAFIVNGVYDAVYSVNSVMTGFLNAQSVQDLINRVLPIAVLLFTVVLAFIGFQFLMKKQEANTLIANFLVGVIVAVALPTAIGYLSTFTQQAIGVIGQGNMELGDSILQSGVTDTLLYDPLFGTGQSPDSLTTKNNLTEESIAYMNPSELVKPGEYDLQHPEVWKHCITTDSAGNTVVEEVSSGFFGVDFLSSYYYRWDIDWLTIFATLIITTVALLFSGIKIARLLYEIVVHQLMAQALGFLDIYSGQRLKRCLQSLIASFVTLFGCFLLLQLYMIGMTYVSQNVDNLFAKLICLAALAWAVIDGPNIFEQVVGIDAGLNSTVAALVGIRSASRIVGSAGRTASKVTRTAASAVSKVGGGAAKAASSFGGAAAGTVAGKRAAAQGANILPASMQKNGSNAPDDTSPDSPANGQRQEDGAAGGSDNLNPSSRPSPDSTPNGGSGKKKMQYDPTTHLFTATDAPSTPSPSDNAFAAGGAASTGSGQSQGADQGAAAPSAGADNASTMTASEYHKNNLKQSVNALGAVQSAKRSYSLHKNSAIFAENKKEYLSEAAKQNQASGMTPKAAKSTAKKEFQNRLNREKRK